MNLWLMIDQIPLTKAQRDHLYLLCNIVRWTTCDHKRTYWANGVDGYHCPTCGRNGYQRSPFYAEGCRSN